MSALVVAAVPSSQTGVASGMNANIRTIGGSIGSAVMASIVISQLEPFQRRYREIVSDPEYVAGVLRAGAERVTPIARLARPRNVGGDRKAAKNRTHFFFPSLRKMYSP